MSRFFCDSRVTWGTASFRNIVLRYRLKTLVHYQTVLIHKRYFMYKYVTTCQMRSVLSGYRRLSDRVSLGCKSSTLPMSFVAISLLERSRYLAFTEQIMFSLDWKTEPQHNSHNKYYSFKRQRHRREKNYLLSEG